MSLYVRDSRYLSYSSYATCTPISCRSRIPSMQMFFSALASRSCFVWQTGQVHLRTSRFFVSVFRYPQQWHNWEDGYQRSTFRKYFPARSILYWTFVRKPDHPADEISLDMCRFRIMLLTERSSQMNASQLTAMAWDSLL